MVNLKPGKSGKKILMKFSNEKKILISESAQQDITQFISMIRLDKPQAADKFKKLLKNKIQSLELFSERGRKIPELRGTSLKNYRELIVKPCRLVYRVTPGEVRIIRVLHSKRTFSLGS